jgi:3-isopropylmalate/(R)-2-methylmalate dehydratase large subunit
VTSAQASGFAQNGRKRPGRSCARRRRPQCAHHRPQAASATPIGQKRRHPENTREFGIDAGMNDIRQGIVHIIGPEQGWTLPGSPSPAATSSHAWRLADRHGIGTRKSTCCRPRRLHDTLQEHADHRGSLGVTAKDIIWPSSPRSDGAAQATSSNMRATRFMLTMEGRRLVQHVDEVARAPDRRTTTSTTSGRPRAPKARRWKPHRLLAR